LHVLLLIDDESPSESNQNDHRRNPPHQPEHREEGPHLVGPKRSERLSENFRECHNLSRNGNRLPARAFRYHGYALNRKPDGKAALRSYLKLCAYCSTTWSPSFKPLS